MLERWKLHTTQESHILDILDVKDNLKWQDPVDFDATLFLSSVAAAYLEHFKSYLGDWSSHSQEQDLVGDVFPLIIPIKSAHYNNGCDVNCSNYAQDKLHCLALDA